MSFELLVIIAIVIAIVITQFKLVANGNEKIQILRSVFNAGASYAKTWETSGIGKWYVTQKIYIPKSKLKELTWEEMKDNLADYKYNADDVKEEKIINHKEIHRRKAIIQDLEDQLSEEGPVEQTRLKKELEDALVAFISDERNGKFETIKRTVVCRKEDKEEIQVILLNNTNPIAEEIEHSINTYLLRNKGAVSDFNLIKDIVERNCDAIGAEIESITPMPLYLGLAGTMSGIIIGLGIIGLTLGFGNIQYVVDALMSEVALAMVASLSGVLSTTYISWKSRTCNVRLEADKNNFYTWIQTELLPVLSNSTVSTLTLLERNLSKFNHSFGETIVKLDEKLSKVGETYAQQIDILQRIEKLDVTKMATANVKVLRSLDSSSGNLKAFAQFMQNSTDYLSEVRKLTDQLDSYLARTGSLETIAEFYKKQMAEIASRQDAIRTTVVTVDDTVQKALAGLEEHTEKGLAGLKQTFVRQQDEMEKIAQQQGNKLNEKLSNLDAAVAFGAETVDYSKSAIIFQLTSMRMKIDEFIELMRDYNIIEICRTGVGTLERGDANLRQAINL